jgi:molecular chaperone GrpE
MSAEPKKPEPEVDETGATESDHADAVRDEVAADTVADLQAKVDENWDRYVRTAAELENVRKRAQRDVENAHRFALESFSKELLAVVDSLEMGLEAAESADAAALRDGSEATCKLLKSTMGRFGLEEVDPEGEPFDPEFHEAMSMMPSADVEPGSVLTVIQKGYTLNGRLLRPARVIVAAEAPVADPAE